MALVMTHPDTDRLLGQLRDIAGPRNVLTGDRSTRRYRSGFRFGGGAAIAVVFPRSLLQQWRILKACVAANAAVITQASNTGLTGGSTPFGHDYDRRIVIVNTLRLDRIHTLDGGKQVVCLPGATLYQLESRLKPLGRDPHSVIGSSCIGASVVGGVCNNSGGSLVNRGPAYTELALYARVDENGQVQLVNDLGIDLGHEPEDILERLDAGTFSPDAVRWNGGAASDSKYIDHVRDIDAATPARYNADPTRLFGASGCAGKVMVFAVRLDTFVSSGADRVIYVGTNRPEALAALRRAMLSTLPALPIAAEYMHRDAFDIADRYGKDVFIMIEKAGTARLPRFFAIKNKIDAVLADLGLGKLNVSERVLQWISSAAPDHLPKRMRAYRDAYEHHLMVKISEAELDRIQSLIDATIKGSGGDYFLCSPDEGKKAFLHRFAAAGAAIRYRAVHSREVEDIVALDIALRRNDTEWFETLPNDIDAVISKKLYYGHFLCHVFHQDYIVEKGTDCMAIEHRMLEILDGRGAEYPAEHNVGHLYPAKPNLSRFYRDMDPCNCFNPGIGQTSKFHRYREPT
jgi:D-lactate dehydrogenase